MRTPKTFIIFISFFLALIGAASWFVVNTAAHVFPNHAYTIALFGWIPFAFFPLLLLGTMIVRNVKYIPATKYTYLAGMTWLPFLIYLFLSAVIVRVYDLLGPHTIATKDVGLILFFASVGVMIIGTIQALRYAVATYEISAPLLKEKWGDKKIILVSDVHLGMVRRRPFAEYLVTTINKLSPDIVFIAGDLIDGPIFPYDDDLSPLGQIKSTFGTHYAAGNHDEYNSEQEKYYASLTKYINVLNDKKIILNDTQIVGVRFAAEKLDDTKKRLVGMDYKRDMPSIAMLHDPKNVQALADMGVTLTLSGHTHGGQFWPFSMTVKAMYGSLARGVNYIGKMAQFTSMGIGTGGPVFRLGTRPEIVVLKIK